MVPVAIAWLGVCLSGLAGFCFGISSDFGAKLYAGRCRHKWVHKERINVYTGHTKPSYFDYIRECEHCGKLRRWRL